MTTRETMATRKGTGASALALAREGSPLILSRCRD